MKTIKEMETEVREVMGKVDYREHMDQIDMKLSLIGHLLLHGSKELSPDDLASVSYLVSEVRHSLTLTEELCEKVEDYFFFLNRPDRIAEFSRAEEVASG